MNVFKRIFLFYYDGFREMTIGRTLWLIIAVKLFIMFAILKFFFFPNAFKGLSDGEKTQQVVKELIYDNSPKIR